MDRWTIGRAWIVGGGLLWLALALVMASDPVPSGSVLSLLVGALGFAVGVAWVIYSLAWLGVFRSWRRAVVWVAVPLFPVVAAHALRTGWPLAVRVWLSESSLHEAAAVARIDRIDPFEHVDGHKAEPKRIGLFQVRAVIPHPGGAVTLNTGYGYFMEGGIVYAPNGPPGPVGEGRVSLRHLYGPWYRYAVSD
jgi:hypothetical protein